MIGDLGSRFFLTQIENKKGGPVLGGEKKETSEFCLGFFIMILCLQLI